MTPPGEPSAMVAAVFDLLHEAYREPEYDADIPSIILYDKRMASRVIAAVRDHLPREAMATILAQRYATMPDGGPIPLPSNWHEETAHVLIDAIRKTIR